MKACDIFFCSFAQYFQQSLVRVIYSSIFFCVTGVILKIMTFFCNRFCTTRLIATHFGRSVSSNSDYLIFLNLPFQLLILCFRKSLILLMLHIWQTRFSSSILNIIFSFHTPCIFFLYPHLHSLVACKQQDITILFSSFIDFWLVIF